MPITVKARDGKTDLYGLMFTPTNLDSTKKYPIVNHIYPGPADGKRRQRAASRRRAATPGARRAGLHRRRDRRHGHAVALEDLPRRLLRRDGRQHPPRSGRRDEGARAALPVDRPRSRRHLGPLRRRLRHRRRDVPLSRTSSRSASPSRATTTTASTRTTGASATRGCSCSNADGTDNYDAEANQTLREEPEGQAAARARHDGRQRAARTTRCSSSTR